MPDIQHDRNYFSTMYCMVLSNRYIFALSSSIKNIISKKIAMKNLRSLPGIVLLFILMNTSYAAVSVPVQAASEVKAHQSVPQTVKAVRMDGKLIPVVDLPEITVNASKHATILLSGYIQNGEFVGRVFLPSVEISANAVNENKLPVTYFNGQSVAMVQLPVIDIVAGPLNSNLFTANLNSGGKLVAVINLPEIEINGSESAFDHAVRSLVFNENETSFASVLNFPLFLENAMKSEAANLPSGKWISMSIENCKWLGSGKVACELISRPAEVKIN